MEGVQINQQNRKVVELVFLVEAGTFVQNMDPMKKVKHEEVLLRKDMNIINEIEDGNFENDTVQGDILNGNKDAKKKLSGANLLRKLEVEMNMSRSLQQSSRDLTTRQNYPAEQHSSAT
jgi:hypothetical protein